MEAFAEVMNERARQLGATRPGGPAAGLSDQFTVHRDDTFTFGGEALSLSAAKATLEEMRARLGRPLADRGVAATQVIDDLAAVITLSSDISTFSLTGSGSITQPAVGTPVITSVTDNGTDTTVAGTDILHLPVSNSAVLGVTNLSACRTNAAVRWTSTPRSYQYSGVRSSGATPSSRPIGLPEWRRRSDA